MVSAKISSKDLDSTIVLRLLSLELQMICPCHPIVVVVSLYKCSSILVLHLIPSTTIFF